MAKINRPALKYYGGKWNSGHWIIGHFPPHTSYIEPCGGAASVLLQKPASDIEIYNDLDGNVVNYFRVLRDRPDELIRKIRLTPWARVEYELSLQPTEDEAERARRFYVKCWQSINGGPSPELSSSGWRTGSRVHHDFDHWEHLESIVSRFKVVQIENKECAEVILSFDSSESLFYIDPPYPSNTRTHRNNYTQDWDTRKHEEIASLLRQVSGFVVVSGYACDLYRDLYESYGWQRRDKRYQTNSGSNRLESIWLSPRTANALVTPRQIELFRTGVAK